MLPEKNNKKPSCR